MAATNFASKLKTVKGTWAKTQQAVKTDPKYQGRGPSVPDGNYVVRVTGLKLDFDKNKNLCVKGKLTVVGSEDGGFIGSTINYYNGLEPFEERLGYFLRDLSSMGVDVDAITDPSTQLEPTLKMIEDAKLGLNVRTWTKPGQDMANVYINGAAEIEEGMGVGEENAGAEGEEESAPAEEAAPAPAAGKGGKTPPTSGKTPPAAPAAAAGKGKGGKGKSAPEPEPVPDTGGWEIGDKCKAPFPGMDGMFDGEIIAFDAANQTAHIRFTDGDEDPAAAISSLEAAGESAADEREQADVDAGAEAAGAEEAWVAVEGQRCRAPYNGEYYPGTIESIDKTGKAKIKFDDGDELFVPADELIAEEAPEGESIVEEAVEEPLAVGDAVSFEHAGKRYNGKVKSVDVEHGAANITPEKPIPGVKTPSVRVTIDKIEKLATPAGKD
jgi:hypothetical protein